MEKIPALEEAMERNNLVGIYSVFYTIAHGDPNFSTNKFQEVLQYVKSKNIEGFFEEFDGEEFETEDKWDEDYWALVASSLMDNFCEERISHLKQVGRKVYPMKLQRPSAPMTTDQASGSEKRNISGNKTYEERMPDRRRKHGLITEEEKRQLKSNHAKNHRSHKEGFLGRLFSGRKDI